MWGLLSKARAGYRGYNRKRVVIAGMYLVVKEESISVVPEA
jgi:hypothetical protein